MSILNWERFLEYGHLKNRGVYKLISEKRERLKECGRLLEKKPTNINRGLLIFIILYSLE